MHLISILEEALSEGLSDLGPDSGEVSAAGVRRTTVSSAAANGLTDFHAVQTWYFEDS